MDLTDRLRQCFDATSRDEAEDYLSIIRDAWRDISAAITRNAWIIIVLIVGFELASHRAVSKVSFGPFALENTKYVLLFIPPVVSYLFYEQVLLVTRWIETEVVHRYLMAKVSPQIEEYDFDYFVSPRLPGLVQPSA